jgi:hypothetical protein
MKHDLRKSKRFVVFAMLAAVSFLLLGAGGLSQYNKKIMRHSEEESKIRLLAETIAMQSPEAVRGKWCELARKSPRDFLRITCDDLGPLK